jgi:hypothetical protein
VLCVVFYVVCCVLLCIVLLCIVVYCFAVYCCVLLCCVLLCCVLLCCVLLCCVLLCCWVVGRGVLCWWVVFFLFSFFFCPVVQKFELSSIYNTTHDTQHTTHNTEYKISQIRFECSRDSCVGRRGEEERRGYIHAIYRTR